MADTHEFECLRHPDHPNRDIIQHKTSGFSIQVFDLSTSVFRPNAAEVHFYGDNHGDELAFETISYRNQSETFLLAAIQWYAGYIQYKAMRIYRQRPI